MSFYTYLWLREDGTPYYVGKGTGDRAFIWNKHTVRRPKDSNLILIQDHLTEQDALDAEKLLIAYYGRKDNGTGILRNLTDGGENPPVGSHKGHRHSEETKQILRVKSRGNRNASGRRSEEFRKRVSVMKKGGTHAPHTAETKKKIGDKNRVALRGKRQSADLIAKRVAATKARWAKFGKKSNPWSAARRAAYVRSLAESQEPSCISGEPMSQNVSAYVQFG